MKRIYLDNNATTKLDPRVVEAMKAELEADPSNPSSIHSFGREAKMRLAKARNLIADYLSVQSNELIFTSSGTESLNLAMRSIPAGTHVITSPIEHAAVYNTVQQLGCRLTYLPVGKEGHIQLSDLEKVLSTDPGTIVLGSVNSETGVKNPLEAMALLAEKYQVLLIVDGVAQLGKENFSIPKGVSAMAFSGHKIHGPKGTGLLFVRKNMQLKPLLVGGGQEMLRRAGTENLPGIIGLAKAFELLKIENPQGIEKMKRLRDQFEEELIAHIPSLLIHGKESLRVGNTSNISFAGIDGEALLIQLDMQGIAASIGSACSSGSLEPSRVLLQMGYSKEVALSSIRFSFSRFTTEEEIALATKSIVALYQAQTMLLHK